MQTSKMDISLCFIGPTYFISMPRNVQPLTLIYRIVHEYGHRVRKSKRCFSDML